MPRGKPLPMPRTLAEARDVIRHRDRTGKARRVAAAAILMEHGVGRFARGPGTARRDRRRGRQARRSGGRCVLRSRGRVKPRPLATLGRSIARAAAVAAGELRPHPHPIRPDAWPAAREAAWHTAHGFHDLAARFADHAIRTCSRP